MTTKTKRILSNSLLAIPVIVLAIGGTLKLLGAEPPSVVQFLTRSEFGPYMALLGVVSLLLATLLLYPPTKKIGFQLTSCYFAGALCLEIAGAQFPASSIFLSILWISMWISNRELFVTSSGGKP